MGYTHYWYTTRDFSDTEWTLLSKLAQNLINNNFSLVPVAGGFGQGEPEVNNEHIWLNGTAENGMDHETFRMTKIRQGRPAYDDPDKEFNFCKTAHKPYDLYCVHILSIAKVVAPDAIELSSDGGDEVFRRPLEHYGSKLPPGTRQLELLAEKYGWQIEKDNDGQIILYTGVYEEVSHAP